MAENISSDLIWEITRKQSSFLVKRKQAGGVRFSRDPMNLTNIHSRKYEGNTDTRAIGISPGPNGGVTFTTKKADKANKPGTSLQSTTFGPNTPTRKMYRSIVGNTAKRGYRADLRKSAVARASAIRASQKPVKPDREVKLRGAKARKAREEGKA